MAFRRGAWALIGLAAVACGSEDGDAGSGDGAGAAGVTATNNTASTSSQGSGGSRAPGWHALAPLPEPRQECAVAALDGEIYVVGGFDGDAAVVPDVAVYSPATDSWRAAAPLPSPRHHVNLAEVGGKLYVVGSLLGLDFDARPEVYVYDPAADAWSQGAPMPAGTERGGSAVGVVGQTIYVAGGYRGGSVADFSSYDTTTDTWASLPPLPAPRDHLVGGVVGGIFYAVGGRAGGIDGIDGRVDAFDPSAASWTAADAMLTPRGGCAAAATGDGLYVFGGEGNERAASGVFPQAESYHPQGSGWQALAPMPTPRHGTGAAAIDGVLYVPGGATQQAFGAVDTHEAFVP